MYRNSLIIMATTLTNAGISSIFWILAPRVYSIGEIGVAAALISLMAIVSLFSRFGLDHSLVRYFPEKDKGKILGTCLTVTTFAATFLGMAIIVGSVFLSRDLNIIRIWPNPLFFLLFVAADSVVSLVGLAFVANRRPDYYFVQSLVIDTKILFLFPLSVMGAFGILSSIGISIVLCLGISSMLLAKVGIRPSFGIDWKFLKESSRFSAGTYVAGFLAVTGAWILPIMILNMLGAEETAQYYISYAIASLLFLVPSAFCTSLFVEGSHGESLRATALRATVGTYLLLVPMAVILYISGQFLLDIVGEEYVEGLNLLRIMIVSSFFLTTWSIFSTVKKIQKDMRMLLALSGFILVSLTSTAYAFIARFGLIGVGYAWLTTFSLVTVIVVVLAGEAQWLRPRNSSHKKPDLKEP